MINNKIFDFSSSRIKAISRNIIFTPCNDYNKNANNFILRSFVSTSILRSTPITFHYNDVYKVDLPDNHRFPMEKYRLTREIVENKLSCTGLALFERSPLATIEDLMLVHEENYIKRFLTNELTEKENRNIGFPWSNQSVNRTLSSTGGTIASVHKLFSKEARPLMSGHLAGGTHHAFYDYGEGFCIFSDIAVAAAVALRDYNNLVKKILIIDLDVHQGNGNAVIFENNDQVFTFSVQCELNYFSKREKSDYDIDLPAKVSDDQYMKAIEKPLKEIVRSIKPDLIFYQAGVDPIDRLGKLSLTREGLTRRNNFIYDLSIKNDIKLVVTMGGGYPRDLNVNSNSFKKIVEAHADVYLQAAISNRKYFNKTK